MNQPTDPRDAGGDIAGGTPDPHARRNVILDVTRAVLLDDLTVVMLDEPPRDGQPAGRPVLAMLLDGRINKTPERARILYLFDEDGAAAIITELIALASRIGPGFRDRLTDRVRTLIDQRAL